MVTCDFAACREPASAQEDGWWFCAGHLPIHHAIVAGRPLPDLPRAQLLKSRVGTAPCGTDAGARRHYRNGEKPCQACREAAAYQARRRRVNA